MGITLETMDDLLQDPKAHSIFWGAVLAVLGFFGRREVNRIDRAIADSVRKQELSQLRLDMDQRHRENVERLDRIEAATTGTHSRIDDLYRDLPGLIGKK